MRGDDRATVMTGSLALTNCLWWGPSLYCNTCTNIHFSSLNSVPFTHSVCVCLRTRTCMFKVPRSACVGISIRPCVFFPLSRSCSEASLNPSLSVWSPATVWRPCKLQAAHTKSVERERERVYCTFPVSPLLSLLVYRVQRLSQETGRKMYNCLRERERMWSHLMFWRWWWISWPVSSQLYLQGREYLSSAMSQRAAIV